MSLLCPMTASAWLLHSVHELHALVVLASAGDCCCSTGARASHAASMLYCTAGCRPEVQLHVFFACPGPAQKRCRGLIRLGPLSPPHPFLLLIMTSCHNMQSSDESCRLAEHLILLRDGGQDAVQKPTSQDSKHQVLQHSSSLHNLKSSPITQKWASVSVVSLHHSSIVAGRSGALATL